MSRIGLLGWLVAGLLPASRAAPSERVVLDSWDDGREVVWERNAPYPRLPSNRKPVAAEKAAAIKKDLLALAQANQAQVGAGKPYSFGKGPAEVARQYDAVAGLSNGQFFTREEKDLLDKWLFEPAIAAARIQENGYGNGYYSSDDCIPVGLVFDQEDLVRRGYLGPVMLLRKMTDADGHFMESTGYSYGSIERFWAYHEERKAYGYKDWLDWLPSKPDPSTLKYPSYPNPYRTEPYGFVRPLSRRENVIWKSSRLYAADARRNMVAPDGNFYVVGDASWPFGGKGSDTLVRPEPPLLERPQYFLPSVNYVSRFVLRSGPLVDAGLLGQEAKYPEKPEDLAKIALAGETATKWVTLNVGIPGGWHGHYEKLDVYFNAHGCFWLRSPSSDARSSGYQLTNFRYAELTWARNLVTVDGLRQASGTGQPLFFATGPGLHAATASAGYVFSETDHQRTLVLANEYLVLLDDLIPRKKDDREHTFDWTINGWGAMSTDLDKQPEIPPFVAYKYEGGLSDPIKEGFQSGGVWWRAHYGAPRDGSVQWQVRQPAGKWLAAAVGGAPDFLRGCQAFLLNIQGSQLAFGQAAVTNHGSFEVDAPLAAAPESARMPKVLVRKKAAQGCFLAVLEPYWQTPGIRAVQALDESAASLAFSDGRRDMVLVNRQGPRNVLLKADKDGQLAQLCFHEGKQFAFDGRTIASADVAVHALSVRYLPDGLEVYAQIRDAAGTLEVWCPGSPVAATVNGLDTKVVGAGRALRLAMAKGRNAFAVRVPGLKGSGIRVDEDAGKRTAAALPRSSPVVVPPLYPDNSRLVLREHNREGWERLSVSPDGAYVLTGSSWGKPGRYALYRVESQGNGTKLWELASNDTEKLVSMSFLPSAAPEQDRHLLVNCIPANVKAKGAPYEMEIRDLEGRKIGGWTLPEAPAAQVLDGSASRLWCASGANVSAYRITPEFKLQLQWETALDFKPVGLACAGKSGAAAAYSEGQWVLLDGQGKPGKVQPAGKYPFLKITSFSMDDSGSRIVLTRNDNQLFCLDSDGRVKWRYDPGSSGTVSAKPWSRIGRNGKYAYQAGTWGNLNLFDVETGKKLWEFAGVSGGGSWTPVQVVATPNLEYLLAGNFSDVFYLLTSDGRCVSHRPDLASYLNGLAVSDNARTLVTWTTWLHWNGDFGFERHQIWQNEVAAMERTPATPEPPIWTQGDYAEAEGGAP